MRELAWGIMATGRIAASFAQAVMADGARVAAVGSRDQAKADALAAQYGIGHAHGSYEDLCADPAVDIVYVATPHPFHLAGALMAIEAGKPVLIEKPIALSEAQAKAIAAAARRRGVFAMEAMRTRFLPHMTEVRQIVAGGELGELRVIMADTTHNSGHPMTYRTHVLELGGGALLDLGVYSAALAHQFLGEPAAIQASAVLEPTGADGLTAATFSYQEGALATLVAAIDARGLNRATIIGSKARIELGHLWHMDAGFAVLANDDSVIRTRAGQGLGLGLQFQAREVERLVAAGQAESDIMPLDESIAIMRSLDRIRAQIGVVYPGVDQ
ncbi:MAG: Gfo/Idh/MocA family oxidoreductase [Bifidobacteriaceae bacterium]|jgi:predicted dehydrogenase|nr:Gfo/Idh/MocA family oxidoreductase [Bifidobacteriaceae bacterium]